MYQDILINKNKTVKKEQNKKLKKKKFSQIGPENKKKGLGEKSLYLHYTKLLFLTIAIIMRYIKSSLLLFSFPKSKR